MSGVLDSNINPSFPEDWSSISDLTAELCLEIEVSPKLLRCTESTVVVLPLCPDKLGSTVCPDDFDVESHASPAAFEDAAGATGLRPPWLLADLERPFPSLVPLKVVSKRLLFSGLGVLDICFGGTGNTGGGYSILDPVVAAWSVLCGFSIGDCEPFFCKVEGREGKGGGREGLDRSG